MSAFPQHEQNIKHGTHASHIPLTKTGDDGTAKRNIIRRHPAGGAAAGATRKANSSKQYTDDGSLAAELDPVAFDEGDPNYDSEEDSKEAPAFTPRTAKLRPYSEKLVGLSKMTLTVYKSKVQPIIKDYLVNGEIGECISSILAIDAPEYAYEFVKRAVNMSFDKTDRERERVSKLLSEGYPEIFSSNTIGKGFERLFEVIDDISVDVPNSREMLSTFLARAVVDEIVPPSFLGDSVVCNLGGDIIDHAKRMLSRDHGGARLERVWGPGDGRPVEEMKVAIDQLLAEYLLSKDVDEASRCAKELNSPLFYHELTKRAVVMIIDKTHEQQKDMAALLAYLVERDQLTKAQAIKGFTRLHDLLPDLILDAPQAPTVLSFMTNQAIEDDVLPPAFCTNAP